MEEGKKAQEEANNLPMGIQIKTADNTETQIIRFSKLAWWPMVTNKKPQ
jgi:hypothetical protein